MKPWLLITGLALALALTGCARRYLITLTNTDTLIATTKPKLNGEGWYVFKDANGNEARVRQVRVIRIDAQ